MKPYRRILVPIFSKLHSDQLLHTLRDTLSNQQPPKVIVLRLVNYSSGFEPDGPAANLPAEIAARQAIEAIRRLDLQLTRMGLGWVESRVIWQDIQAQMLKLVGEFQPDLIIARRGSLPPNIPDNIDILNTSGSGFLQRLTDMLSLHPA